MFVKFTLEIAENYNIINFPKNISHRNPNIIVTPFIPTLCNMMSLGSLGWNHIFQSAHIRLSKELWE